MGQLVKNMFKYSKSCCALISPEGISIIPETRMYLKRLCPFQLYVHDEGKCFGALLTDLSKDFSHLFPEILLAALRSICMVLFLQR